MAEKIAIIGAGIAGLSTGCYARMNGFDAEIFEAQSVPGGLCTAWKRGDYWIDGCIHWLTGSGPGNDFYDFWNEIGALEGKRIVDHEAFVRLTDREGRELVVYSDADRLEAHLKELSPEDKKPIEQLCGWIRRAGKINMPMDKAAELMGPVDFAKTGLAMVPHLGFFRKMGSLTAGSFAERFRSPFLRATFPHVFGAAFGMIGLVMTLVTFNQRSAGYPIGGSRAFAESIEKRFLELGGSIHYGARVAKILVENSSAVGIRLEDGSEVRSDWVVSASDLRATVDKLLDRRYVEPQHEELYAKVPISPSMVQVAFGVSMDLSGEPDCVYQMFELPEPVTIGGQQVDWVSAKNYAYDPTLAPAGKTVAMLMLPADYDYWKNLASDRPNYDAEKERVARSSAEILERRYPGFKAAIEETDVATPATFERYTSNYRGSFMTWMMPFEMTKGMVIKKTLPGLDRFYLAGMWVMAPGGLPAGVKTGRDVVQIICSKTGRRFRTEAAKRTAAKVG